MLVGDNLPELGADLVAALPALDVNDFAARIAATDFRGSVRARADPGERVPRRRASAAEETCSGGNGAVGDTPRARASRPRPTAWFLESSEGEGLCSKREARANGFAQLVFHESTCPSIYSV
jgi:hypothetical protein